MDVQRMDGDAGGSALEVGDAAAAAMELLSGEHSRLALPHTRRAAESVVRWLEQGASASKPVTIVALVNPDWSRKEGGGLEFGGSMQRLLAAIPNLTECLTGNNIAFRMDAVLDDFHGRRRRDDGVFTRDATACRKLFINEALKVAPVLRSRLKLMRLGEYIGASSLDSDLVAGAASLVTSNDGMAKGLALSREGLQEMLGCIRRVRKAEPPEQFVRDVAPIAAAKVRMLHDVARDALIIAPDVFSANFGQLLAPSRRPLPILSAFSVSRRNR